MAMTVDTTSEGSGEATTVSVAHTCSASTNLLVVSVQVNGQDSTVTYNSVAMTLAVRETDGGSGARAEIWYLANPSTGSSYNVTVTPAATTEVAIGTISFEGANADDPLGTTAGFANSASSSSLTVATESDAGFCVDSIFEAFTAAKPTVGAGQTQHEDQEGFSSGGNRDGAGSYEAFSSGANTVMSWTLGGTGGVAHAAAEFKDSSSDTTEQATDGSKMYMMGFNGNIVYQYSLSPDFDISTASYDSKSKSIASEDTDATCLFFSDDGSKMFVGGYQNDKVYAYDLSTSWDVSTASYGSEFKSVSGEASEISGIFFKADGLRMFISDNNTDDVFSYTLSTAWDVSTASYDSKSYAIPSVTGLGNLWLNDAGSRLFVINFSDDKVSSYTLTTAWDLSTASDDSKSYDTTPTSTNTATGVTFSEDGTKMYVTAFGSQECNAYTLSIAYDVSTATADSDAFDFSSQDSQPRNIAFGVADSTIIIDLTEAITLVDTFTKTPGKGLSETITLKDQDYVLEFSAGSDAIDFGDKAAFDLTSNKLSIEIWYTQASNNGTDDDLISRYKQAGGAANQSWLFRAGVRYILYIRDSGGTLRTINPSIAPSEIAEEHLVWSLDGVNAKFYIDSVLQYTTAFSHTPTSAPATKIRIGARDAGTDGLLDGSQVGVTRAWNGSLDQADVDSLFNDGVNLNTEDIVLEALLTDGPGSNVSESGGNDGTISGGITWVVTDTPLFFTVLGKILNESISLVDSFIRTITKVFTETITLVDSFIRTLSRAFTETITLTDTIVTVLGKFLNEAISLNDTLVRTVSKALTETVTLVDTIANVVAKAFTETVTLVDTLTRTIGKIFTETIKIAASTHILITLNGITTGLWDKTARVVSSWTETARKVTGWDKVDRE